MDNGTKRVTVLGANGQFGRAAVAAFAGAGWQVRAQLREPGRWAAKVWPSGVEPVFCDALDSAALAATGRGAQVVVNALNPPQYTRRAWETMARRFGHNAIAAAKADGALLMFPGNVYNFGRDLPEQLREDTPSVGNTSKGRIRIDMETALRTAAGEGLDCVVLRAGDYIGGPPTYSWFDSVIAKSLGAGRLSYPGPLDRVHAWTYLPDFAASFVQVAERREAVRGFTVFHGPSYAITGAELGRAVGQARGRPVSIKPMPWWPLRLAAPFSPMMRALLEMRYLWQRPHRLEGTALAGLIGTVPATPLAEALHDILAVRGLLAPQRG